MTPMFSQMTVAVTLACQSRTPAANPLVAFAGEWIWDPAHYVPLPGMASLTHRVGETRLVSRGDGVHDTGQLHHVRDDGQTETLDENLPADRRGRRIGPAEPP